MPFFTKDYHQFLSSLNKNNNRVWFNEHKQDYIDHVKKPFEKFIEILLLKSRSVDDSIMITPKESIFRIYRDVRFRKDKTPYKTNMSASISRYGRKKMLHPGIFVQLGVDGLMLASGTFHPDPSTRDKIRDYMAENLSEFKKIINEKQFKKYWGEIQGEKSKVLAKEYKQIINEEPLIANKQFYVIAKLTDPKILISKDLDKTILTHFKAVKPLATFLTKAMASK
ncbi:MAG: hypothetical protein ACI9QC_000182 [Oceanicoccus sp.]|jgi:uncharacterized protein (TIGR02453 family)